MKETELHLELKKKYKGKRKGFASRFVGKIKNFFEVRSKRGLHYIERVQREIEKRGGGY